jgi:hypothetical protein
MNLGLITVSERSQTSVSFHLYKILDRNRLVVVWVLGYGEEGGMMKRHEMTLWGVMVYSLCRL